MMKVYDPSSNRSLGRGRLELHLLGLSFDNVLCWNYKRWEDDNWCQAMGFSAPGRQGIWVLLLVDGTLEWRDESVPESITLTFGKVVK